MQNTRLDTAYWAEKIKQFKKETGFTNEQVAREVGVSTPTINSIVGERQKGISLKTAGMLQVGLRTRVAQKVKKGAVSEDIAEMNKRKVIGVKKSAIPSNLSETQFRKMQECVNRAKEERKGFFRRLLEMLRK